LLTRIIHDISYYKAKLPVTYGNDQYFLAQKWGHIASLKISVLPISSDILAFHYGKHISGSWSSRRKAWKQGYWIRYHS